MTRISRGHNICQHCGRLSEPYQLFPLCRDCSETTCPQCTTPGSLHETDGTHPDSVLCLTCSQEN